MNDQQFGGYLSLLVVTFVAVVILIIVVILQNRKIKDLQTPKYGFLGKTVTYSVLFAVFAVGITFSFLYVSNRNTGSGSVSVTDGQEVSVNISYEIINPIANLYRFNVTPTVDKSEWANGKFTFDFYWTLTLGDGNARSFSEEGLSATSPGGIIQQLTSGSNKIRVALFVNGKTISDEITITIP